MRVIVDLYRYLIIGIFALVIIGATFGLVRGLNTGFLGTETGILWVFAAILIIVLMILSLGMVAVAISIHDRYSEVGSEIERIADLMEYRGIALRENSDGN
ncbi:hypothetical protein [Qipengyuania sp. DGS5-3]|uniref:hypothetical protein n=1 Tax=Qipengyuania sp. DGS5-3 TaxID=3349632 RepID=UPI0036D2879C